MSSIQIRLRQSRETVITVLHQYKIVRVTDSACFNRLQPRETMYGLV